MIILNNEWIIVSKYDDSYLPIRVALTYNSSERTLYLSGRKVTKPAHTDYGFTLDKDENMYIPIGILPFLDKYIYSYGKNIVDNRTSFKATEEFLEVIYNINKYENILEGITLRPEQLIACRKILYNKRCLVQCNTGFGKSEVACAFVELINEIERKYPTVLMIEPTSRLVEEIYERFDKYHIPVVKYSDNRKIIKNKVNVCHPKSLNIDMAKDPTLLEDVRVLIGDECHHYKSDTYRNPVSHMPNLEYSVGLSASGISQEHVGLEDIHDYSFNEVLVMEATGPLVMNVKAEDMIDIGNLADPVLLILNNPADEYLHEKYVTTWTKISQVKLESDYRNKLIVEASRFFSDKERKVLILVSTIRWAQKLLKMFDDYGLSDTTRASYGGRRFEYYNGHECVNDSSDVIKDFNSGVYSIMIGTSHIYEGADFKGLDVLVMASAGRSERIQIQCAGRVLRKSKNGKYAYIVDFTDENDVVLSKHSRNRLDRYKEIIGVPGDRIYYNISVDDIENIFNKLEDV